MFSGHPHTKLSKTTVQYHVHDCKALKSSIARGQWSVYISTYRCNYPCIHPSMSALSFYLSLALSPVCLSICLSVCLSVWTNCFHELGVKSLSNWPLLEYWRYCSKFRKSSAQGAPSSGMSKPQKPCILTPHLGANGMSSGFDISTLSRILPCLWWDRCHRVWTCSGKKRLRQSSLYPSSRCP